MTLPNLIIIGAMKSGTTSLHYYLGLHPQIHMSREKELSFFVTEHNWGRGLAWYEAQFGGPAPVQGEASPQYTNYPMHQGVVLRMHSIVPQARLIYILRDPIERIRSHWQHLYASELENHPLEEALATIAEDDRYVTRSAYAMQLGHFLPYYPLERILILTQEELDAEREATLRQIFRWLGVDENFTDPRFRRRKHESTEKRRLTPLGRRLAGLPGLRLIQRLPTRYRSFLMRELFRPWSYPVLPPQISPALRARLQEALAPDMQRLRELTGRSFDVWSV